MNIHNTPMSQKRPNALIPSIVRLHSEHLACVLTQPDRGHARTELQRAPVGLQQLSEVIRRPVRNPRYGPSVSEPDRQFLGHPKGEKRPPGERNKVAPFIMEATAPIWVSFQDPIDSIHRVILPPEWHS
jgi:hypothetical protein